jgi:hypothetical protein
MNLSFRKNQTIPIVQKNQHSQKNRCYLMIRMFLKNQQHQIAQKIQHSQKNRCYLMIRMFQQRLLFQMQW